MLNLLLAALLVPQTPNFIPLQGYRAAAPNGVAAQSLTNITGGWGDNVKFCDIEFGWEWGHEDIAGLVVASMLNPPIYATTSLNHGTACVGIVCAAPNSIGVVGLSPDATIHTATSYTSTGTVDVATAIYAAMSAMGTGDVILLEAQAVGPGGSTPSGVPTEWNSADYNAIVSATSSGFIVIEPAGNGGADLDSSAFGSVFNLAVQDSGAIVVGSSVNSTLARSSASCYGSRVDCNGWGDSIATTAYGDLQHITGTNTRDYTALFGGTSGASAIVAGVVCGIRGAAQAQLSATDAAALTPSAIRTLLRTYGTSMNSGQSIGKRPDLAQILVAAGIQRELRLTGDGYAGNVMTWTLTPSWSAGSGDLWALESSATAINQSWAPPGITGSRLLIDLTTAIVLAGGTFASSPATYTFTVPAGYGGTRLYQQAFFLRANGNVQTSNSTMLYAWP